MAYKVLELIGYYRAKKSIKHKFFCRRLRKEDAQRKEKTLKQIYALQEKQLKRCDDGQDVIVSLTSYGDRVSDTLPYTLYSLLRQTRMPNRIVVWLDNVNWNEEKLSPELKKLEALGIEFYFVEDLRSYKKLIPALKMFPNNVIITVDDDLYYNRRTVEWLMNAYENSDRHTVFGTWAYMARVSEDGHYLPYSQWKTNSGGTSSGELSLIGCGGILYPPRIFDEEILKKDLFMSMAPTADDLWFWSMEKRQNIPVQLIPKARRGLHVEVNRIDFWDPEREGSLYYINEVNGKNDEQLKRLIEYYGLFPG